MTNQRNISVSETSTSPGRVLWLASWYPSEVDPLEGDFIQRHAEAVSAHCTIDLWCFVHNTQERLNDEVKIVKTVRGNLTEYRVNYTAASFGTEKIDRFLRRKKMLSLGKKVIDAFYSEQNRPILIHSHVALYSGILALFFSKKWKIPYMVSEHWTGYLPEATPNFRRLNRWTKQAWQNIITNAAVITTVSEVLKTAIQKLSGRREGLIRIPNVVSEAVFKPEPTATKAEFVTISADSHQKNLDEVLQACRILQQQAVSFLLHVVHHPDEALKLKISELGLQSVVHWHDPMPQSDLATLMASCRATLLYSRFETFGCVVIESLACGVPVIVADIPVLAELIEDGTNGHRIPLHQPDKLAYCMMQLANTPLLEEEKIRLRAAVLKLYNYSTVGDAFMSIYRQILA